MAHSKQAEIAARYDYRCGYCGVTEVDSGGALSIDHYRPVSDNGDESDENLVYACFRYNMYKSDYSPNAAQIAVGHFVLHPLQDAVSQHVHENELTGELEPLTETGRFHIEILHLNRRQLAVSRQRRWLRRLSEETRASLAAETDAMQAEVAAYQRYTEHLERLLGWSSEN